MTLRQELSAILKGEIADDEVARTAYAHDASLFEIAPELIVAPKDVEDVERLVGFAAARHGRGISLTARSAGTDMSGGAVGESVIVDFSKHLVRLKEIGEGYAIVEPGMPYRDFEKETLKTGQLLPSYPASRELCTVGGMAANNSGGEKSLRYGKTAVFVEGLKVVFADGEIGRASCRERVSSPV